MPSRSVVLSFGCDTNDITFLSPDGLPIPRPRWFEIGRRRRPPDGRMFPGYTISQLLAPY
jgi:hypothetical protein